ncbi:Por secretion system C-terminal sorting domain-containing protein [Soonwooa buanensis]|uniref:Por secretion system C-terminal sorting domain-containing protein n=1 Tax=Soonwooa buanensis TaxID=619805 RepID=A0A1T5F431_9FLAO|nr:T9SS-dependent M36 family metallopeptidase [Soonwooa buanensis]SKB90955.1 Por secretion system C-terminal sorting domain-containing protein [Soonwooa buanensis]
MKRNQLKAFLILPAVFAFIFGNAQSYEDQISQYLKSDKKMAAVPTAINDFKIRNIDNSQSMNADVVVVQQKINGIPVFAKSATFLIKDKKIVSATNGFATSVTSTSNIASNKASLSAESAFAIAANRLKIKNQADYKFAKNNYDKKGLLKINSVGDVTDELVYFIKGTEARLAHQIRFTEKGTSNSWLTLVDAQNSEILFQYNTTVKDHFHDSESFLAQNYNSENAKKTFAFPQNKTATTSLLKSSAAKYNVFKLPVESPSFGNRTIVDEPFNQTYAPLGWNNTGDADLTDLHDFTVGNNVTSYSDPDNTDQLVDPAQLAYGGTERNFDFPYDGSLPAYTFRDAALTNLFYINNMVHDVSYQFGFTESARNFQYNNLGKGGEEKDFILAQGQDGGGLDNANFAPYPEGTPGVMQMYLWTPPYYSGVHVNAPSDLADFATDTKFPMTITSWPENGVTGDLVVAQPEDACTELTNNVTGKIVLVKRGTCTFTDKSLYVLAGGAAGALFYNANPADAVVSYAPTFYEEPVYSALINNESGLKLKQKLDQNIPVNININKDYTTITQPDGSLDNAIVSHEYTHGISNRLTGLGDGTCLNAGYSNEQMGEGWSDYMALMLTLRPTDNATIPRGIGTYALSEPTTGAGIRPAKYSPDFSINNFTYGKTNGMEVPAAMFGVNIGTVPDVHSIGFVWATMLWDLTWKMVDKYGYNSDVTADANSGTAKTLQLVMDGMKLQQCNPSFINGRDAIIEADQQINNGANKCLIWDVFANRGLGVNASPGGLNGNWYQLDEPNPELYDQVEDFEVPQECKLATNETASKTDTSIYPNPAKDQIFINTKNAKGNLIVKIYNMVGNLVSESKIASGSNQSINTSKLTNGVYVVKVEGFGIDQSQKLIIRK